MDREQWIHPKTQAGLHVYPVTHAKGNIIICPGGGFHFLSPRESDPVASAFQKEGWQAYILNYSVGAKLGTTPMEELAWAVQQVKMQHPEAPLVICGFSAGGHVAASYAVHWQDRQTLGELTGVRPDGLILCYPVITAGEHRHKESLNALCSEGDCEYYSLEKHITEYTPPSFLWHTADDETVAVENSLLFAQGLIANKVPVELHIYPSGVHGLSLATEEVSEPQKGRLADKHIAGWWKECMEWLEIIKNQRS